jgi:hypothetical protein
MTRRDADREPARVVFLFWSAWITAVAAGMILVGMVDDSPFVAAMNGNFLFHACWIGIEVGSIVAGFAIAIAGVPLAWSLLRGAFLGRPNTLYRMALPFAMIGALVAWIAAVLVATAGQGAAPPWAVAISRPDWPSALIRSITGSISAVRLVAVLAASVMSVRQILGNTEFLDVRLSLAGARLDIAPLRHSR